MAVFNNALYLGQQPVQLFDAYGNPVTLNNPLPMHDEGDLQKQILAELRSIRLALALLVSEGGRCKPEDFDPAHDEIQ